MIDVDPEIVEICKKRINVLDKYQGPKLDYAKIASKMFKILHNFKENEKECIMLIKC